MHRTITVFYSFLLIFLAQLMVAERGPDEWRSSIENHIKFFAETGPRIPGSLEEKLAIEYINHQLKVYGLEPRTFNITDKDLDHPLFSVIDTTIEGLQPDTLLIVIPINTQFSIGKDSSHVTKQGSESIYGSISLAIALSLANALSSASLPPITVRFLFLGSEYQNYSSSSGLGSRLFLREFQAHRPIAMLYFDLNDIPIKIIPHAGANGVESPPWLVSGVADALTKSNIASKLKRANISYPVRLQLPWEPILSPYYQANIPALRLAGEYGSTDQNDQDLWITNIRNFFDLLLATFEEGIPATWDRHYLLLNISRRPLLIIPESLYVISVVIACAALISYMFSISHRLQRFLVIFSKDGWRILPLLIILAGGLIASNSTIGLILNLKGDPTVWQASPLLFLSLKLSLLILIVSLANYLPGAYYLLQPKHGLAPNFHGVFAIVFFLILVVAAMTINISLAFPLIWSLICAQLTIISRNRWMALLWTTTSPLWIIIIIGSLLSQPSLFVQSVLFAPATLDLIIAMILLPFILLYRAGIEKFVGYQRIRPEFRQRTVLHVTTAIISLTVIMQLIGSFSIKPV